MEKYLQADSDFFSKRSLREDSLYLWYSGWRHGAAFGTNRVDLLPNARYHGEIMWEIYGKYPHDTRRLEIL